MNAEELFEQGMRLLDESRELGIAGYSASMANTYFQAAAARGALDSQSALLATHAEAIAQTQSPVTNFASAIKGTDVPWIHECGHIEWWHIDGQPSDGGCDACESSSSQASDWHRLYIRVPS